MNRFYFLFLFRGSPPASAEGSVAGGDNWLAPPRGNLNIIIDIKLKNI